MQIKSQSRLITGRLLSFQGAELAAQKTKKKGGFAEENTPRKTAFILRVMVRHVVVPISAEFLAEPDRVPSARFRPFFTVKTKKSTEMLFFLWSE